MPKLTVIPATKNSYTSLPINAATKRRVAAYARVSTDSDEQATSYEAQVDYYSTYIRNRADWIFVGVYSDEGISGLNMKHRDGFNEMVRDALDGKIDLIITKSVSRFARNTVDSLTTIRKLKEVGCECYFEKENIYTFDGKGEVLLTIMSSLAQEESRSISENVRWGYRKRFSDGKVSLAYSHFLGYDKGENGTLKVVPEQARIVRIIYKKFLDGQTTQSIARDLTEQGIPTPMGKANWSASTILSILRNEKYKGDALLQKSFTTDYLTKKMKKNEGEIPQYLVEGAHEAIIDPEQFELVQEELARRREMGRSYKDIVFHGKIICGDCGGLYGKKLWHSTDKYRKLVFQCNEKFKQSNKCATPKFSEEEIKTRFLLAYNKLLQNRSSVLSDCETVRKMLCDTEAIEMQISETETEIAVAAEMMSEHVKKNASIALSQDRYAEEASRIEQRYNDAVERRRELLEERDRRKRKDKELKAYIHSIKKGPLILDEWDEQLWITILDTATVYRDGRIEFCFKGGKRITG